MRELGSGVYEGSGTNGAIPGQEAWPEGRGTLEEVGVLPGEGGGRVQPGSARGAGFGKREGKSAGSAVVTALCFCELCSIAVN